MLHEMYFVLFPLSLDPPGVTFDLLVLKIKTHPESPRMMTFSSTFFLEVIFSALNIENMKI